MLDVQDNPRGGRHMTKNEATENEDLGEYYYNVRTRMVEKGRLSPWEHLMGPYETLEEAEKALEIAAARNIDWDEEDDAWAGLDDQPEE
jgi:hypothetical protein